MSHADRIERLRAQFAEGEIDSFLVTSAENRAYLSGFRGTAGYLWITPQDALLATDSRYRISFGFSYTFGSIFNNVVNPRF